MAAIDAVLIDKNRLNNLTNQELIELLKGSFGGAVSSQPAIANVTGNLNGLTAAFNTLLAELRTAGILRTS